MVNTLTDDKTVRLFAARLQCAHGDTEKTSEKKVNMTESIEAEEQVDLPVDDASTPEVAVEEVDDRLDRKTVSKIVERERQKAYAKARKEAIMELEQQQAQQQQQQEPQAQPQGMAPSMGGMQGMSHQDIEALIAQQVPRHLQEQINNVKNEHLVNSFVSKMEAAEQKHPGLQEKLGMLEYGDPSTRKLVEMVTQLDNAGDIMHELLENPEKMSNLFPLIDKQPRLAMHKLQSLGSSITQNQVAQEQHQSAKDPLSQIKPSINAGVSDGNMSVSDFSRYWMQNKL